VGYAGDMPSVFGGGTQNRVWATMPPNVAMVFRPRAADTARHIVREIRQRIPEYLTSPESHLHQSLLRGVDAALAQFIDRLEHRDGTGRRLAQHFHKVGRREFTDGRSLNSLLAAYRIGGQVAWRRVSESCRHAGVPTATLCLVAEAIFAYIDEISTLSIEGFNAARTESTGGLQRRRKHLLDLLLAKQAPPHHQLADVAAEADWPLPERVAVVALTRPGEESDDPTVDFGPGVLADLTGRSPCLITADPAADLTDLTAGLPGWRAAIGPLVPIADARVSWLLARRALQGIKQRIFEDAAVIDCTDHLAELWLLSDPVTMQSLADRALAPLAGLTTKQQSRLAETLLTWLETPGGGAPEVAARIGVHPQTVRNRLHQLETLFGKRLQNSSTRFELELSLRALRLLQRSSAQPQNQAEAGILVAWRQSTSRYSPPTRQ
jgi:hypothetical protein